MMKNWQKLSVPALIFVPMMLMMITSCQTTPSDASPGVLNEVNEENIETACKHFQTPLLTLDDLRDMPPAAHRILGLWDKLWVDYGCDD